MKEEGAAGWGVGKGVMQGHAGRAVVRERGSRAVSGTRHRTTNASPHHAGC